MLRRGCDGGRPSLFWLGLLDLIIGVGLCFLFAVALVVALQAVDYFMFLSQRPALIDLPRKLHMIEIAPGDPANVWLYALLFSTLIPSTLNCVVGMVSLVTWSSPSARRWLLAKIPHTHEPGWDMTRRAVLAVLGGQVFIGSILAGLALWIALWCLDAAAPVALIGFLHLIRYVAQHLTATVTAASQCPRFVSFALC